LIRPLARILFIALAAAALGSAQAQASVLASVLAPLSAPGSTVPPSPWQVTGLPKQALPLTRFALVELDGRRVLRVEADRSYGNLVHPLNLTSPPGQLSWAWRVDRPLAAANLRTKAGDDAAAKVCVFFDLPLDKVPFDERLLLRLARARSSEPLPAATVCYVWDNSLPVDTALANPYTSRMRYLVLQSGPTALGQWRSERRDVAADFLRLFGPESNQVPPLIGIAIGADADNTHGHSLAFVTDLVLRP
jgi:Protein of unknown function (DUF3047)